MKGFLTQISICKNRLYTIDFNFVWHNTKGNSSIITAGIPY